MRDSKKPTTPAVTKLAPRNLQVDQSWLGPSLLVKGEISGHEDLFIDGSMEGVVRLNERKLMIGPTANVKADIFAGEVVVRGNVNGNVCARYRIEIEDDGSLTGDLATAQVFIEDGASFKGSIEIEKSAEKESNEKAFSGIESTPAKVHVAAAGLKSI
jgi:cytoskeletal protein CcmA (bactofilin family)